MLISSMIWGVRVYVCKCIIRTCEFFYLIIGITMLTRVVILFHNLSYTTIHEILLHDRE